MATRHPRTAFLSHQQNAVSRDFVTDDFQRKIIAMIRSLYRTVEQQITTESMFRHSQSRLVPSHVWCLDLLIWLLGCRATDDAGPFGGCGICLSATTASQRSAQLKIGAVPLWKHLSRESVALGRNLLESFSPPGKCSQPTV